MRWTKKPVPYPSSGERRTRRVFAWKPTDIGQTRVWLESYEVHEFFFQPASGNPGWWHETKRNLLIVHY